MENIESGNDDLISLYIPATPDEKWQGRHQQASVLTMTEECLTHCTNKVPSVTSPQFTASTGIPMPPLQPSLPSLVPIPPSAEINAPLLLEGAMEEHTLMLHLCLENIPSEEEGFMGLTKAVAGAQASLKTADKRERDLFVSFLGSKNSILVPRFLRIIETTTDPSIVWTICSLIHDCLAPKCDGILRQQLIRCLVCNSAAEILFKSFRNIPLIAFSKGESGPLNGFQVVAKLASKDSKMAVKCRLVGGVKFTHQLIQTHAKNNQLLLPLLIILKFIAKNPTNQIVLGKDGCVTTLVSILNTVPKSHWAKIKLILEILALLTKTTSVSPRLSATIRAGGQKLQALLNCFFESNVIRMVRDNGLSRILSILESWEKVEQRHQFKVLRFVLYVISHLCDSKHGRKAVLGLKGDTILHRLIVSCPLESRYEPLLGLALNVFLKCSSKGELPLLSLKGAITFKITSSRDSSPMSNADSHETTPDPDHDSSDDEALCGDDEEGDCDDLSAQQGIDLLTSCNPQTTRIDDLIKMAAFFTEFQDGGLDNRNIENRINLGPPCSTPGSQEMYLHLSSSTKSLISFVKVAYPDMIGAEGPQELEPLYQKNTKVIRERVLRTVDRVLNSTQYQEKVVYDLDFLLESQHSSQLHTPSTTSIRNLGNWDEKRIDKKDSTVDHLSFESRFESGNLRRAIKISSYEYDLVLNSDVNSLHHHQWFYFEVSNMEGGVPYIINIINNEKPNSEFNFGMKPVMFSVKEALLGRPFWVRTGYDICYHKNHFVRSPKSSENSKFRRAPGKSFYTATMTVKFPHENDVVYMAYHYPYTYTKLQTFLSTIESTSLPDNTIYKNQTLCHSLNGNAIPLLTITGKNKIIKEKEVVFLTGRVHPGESNSSWVLQGAISFLLGSSIEAAALRDAFVFKIVPMLNPEGVIHGNQRCGLTDEDLNRRWKAPNPVQHPTIYYSKALIEHLTAVIGKRPWIFCDFHGHSRQKNVFMYGCSRQQSWWHGDKNVHEDGSFMALPRLAQLHMRTFSLNDCRFDVERSRESTARVAVWRQFHVTQSYTMEASTCGCDSGPYKNCHLSPKLLLESGEGFCLALFHFGCQNHALHKTLINKRLAWMGSTFSSSSQEENHHDDRVDNALNFDLDSEDDLDFELYGMIYQKLDDTN